jgi:hypothetical protein
MKKTLFLVLIILAAKTNYGQILYKGVSIGVGYESQEKTSLQIGYQLTHVVSQEGLKRFQHRYSAEYLPSPKAIGLSADLAYIDILARVGAQVGYRSFKVLDKTESDFFISPQVGLDFLILDISAGPSFHSYKGYGDVGFKVGLHYNIVNMEGRQKIKALKAKRKARH